MEERINFMCAVVEEYIFKMKGVQVKIDRAKINDPRQLTMLVEAFNIANGN